MIQGHLDAIASFLNFLGGFVLACDALRARRRAQLNLGESFWKSLPRNRDKPETGDLEYWAANLSFRFAITGLTLIALGFLLDSAIKLLAWNPCLFRLL